MRIGEWSMIGACMPHAARSSGFSGRPGITRVDGRDETNQEGKKTATSGFE